MPILLLEIDAWSGAAVETLRFASRSFVTAGNDSPAHVPYLGRILDAGMLGATAFSGGSLGRPQASQGSLILNNQDGALDYLLGYGFDGRAFRLREIEEGALVSTGTLIATGLCAGIDATDAWKSLRVRLRDQMAALGKPLLTTRYAGTSTSTGLGAEGGTDLKDEIKPTIFGSVFNVPLKIANAADLIYQACVNGFATATVFDGGVPLTGDGDDATLAALLASTITPGHYRTSKSLGLIRLGGSPVFAVTADVVEGAAPSDRTAAQVAKRILTFAGLGAGFDAAAFAALDAKNGAEVGIYVTGEDNIGDVIDRVLSSVGAGLLPDLSGKLRPVMFEAPSGASAATYTIRDLLGEGSISLFSGATDEGDGVPAAAVSLTFGKNYSVMSEGDLDRAGITLERRARLIKADQTATSDEAASAAIRVAHPLAVEIKAETLLTTRLAAETEAQRRFLMHSIRRDRLGITVSRERAQGVREGAVVTVQAPRFGFAAGKQFRVVGRTDDFTKRQVTLEMWG